MGTNLGDRILCASIWAETIGVPTKVGFPYGFQNHTERLLYNPVADGRDTQWAHLNPTSRLDFPDVCSPRRLWLKPLGLKVFLAFLEVFLKVFLKVPHIHAITSCCLATSILSDMGLCGS
jgi:hypothetical protein